MAYCGMIETARKRKWFMARLSEMGRGRPSSSTVPPVTFIRPSMKIKLLPRVDLPQPDSPARPMISPSAMLRLTRSTACTSPRRLW